MATEEIEYQADGKANCEQRYRRHPDMLPGPFDRMETAFVGGRRGCGRGWGCGCFCVCCCVCYLPFLDALPFSPRFFS